jgi:Protein of unknown function (DUF4231)
MNSDNGRQATQTIQRKCYFAAPFGELLVTRELLEAVIAKCANEGGGLSVQQQEYLSSRWVSMVMWWHSRSVESKWKYYALQAVIIVGGVLIPVLSALSIQSAWRDTFVICIAFVGALVAAAAAWEGVANHGEIWREKRRAAELLKVEGWLFLSRSGKYKESKSMAEAFPVFAEDVEKMIAGELGQYLSLFDVSLEKSKGAAGDMTSKTAVNAKEGPKTTKP